MSSSYYFFSLASFATEGIDESSPVSAVLQQRQITAAIHPITHVVINIPNCAQFESVSSCSGLKGLTMVVSAINRCASYIDIDAYIPLLSCTPSFKYNLAWAPAPAFTEAADAIPIERKVISISFSFMFILSFDYKLKL